jgi:transcriptional regulator
MMATEPIRAKKTRKTITVKPSTALIDPTTDVKPLTSKPKKIPIEYILELRDKKLSPTEIAKRLECSIANITQRLKRYDERIGSVEAFKKHRAEVMAEKQKEVLGHLTEEKLKKANAKDLCIVYGTLYDKERLERGQSTTNVGLQASVKIAEDIASGNKDTPQDIVIESEYNEGDSVSD